MFSLSLKASDGSNTSELQELEIKIDELREIVRKSEVNVNISNNLL